MPRIVPIKGEVTTIYLLDDESNTILSRVFDQPLSEEILEFLETVVDVVEKESRNRLIGEIIVEIDKKFEER